MKPRLKPVKDQVIVITGASSGIGLATAKMAAARGARVVMAAREADALQTAEEEIRAAGGEAIHVIADVARQDDVDRIAKAAEDAYGGIDTWVNNAAVAIYGRLEDVPLADQRRLFDIDYWGVVHGARTALTHLRRRGGGALINIGSLLSEQAFPLQGPYSAAKHAVKGFTDALRMELIDEGAPIAVTLIKPGTVDTPYTEHAGNVMDVEPRNPPPAYAPELVARAVLHAAEHPTRDMFVGGAAWATAKMAHLAPGLSDRVMGRAAARMQRTDRRPARHRVGLQGPSGEAEVHGEHHYVRRHSTYTWMEMHPMATVGAAVALGAAAAVIYARR